MAECYNTACPYCADYSCKRTATCDMRLDGEYVKVKHGRWIKWEGDVLTCSNCKRYWIQSGDQYDFRYCPNCGAKMDEVEE